MTDLAKCHGNCAVIRTCRQSARSTGSNSSCNTRLGRTIGLVAASSKQSGDTCGASRTALVAASKEVTEELALPLAWHLDVVFYAYAPRSALVGRRCSARSHEGPDHDCSIDIAVALGTAQRPRLAAGNLTVSDNGRVCLRSTAAAFILALQSRFQ